MDLAWISLAALIVAITLSMVTSVNVGVVSLAMAWIVGVYLGGMPLAKVIGNFPIDLLLNLVGVTLLFGMANNNGTLGRIAARAVRACRGNSGLIPIMLFFIALGLSSIGPGNIATTAIMAPMAMAAGLRAAVPPFLMALMVGNGAQAGALSRFAPTGIIVNTNMEKIGLAGFETQTYLNNLAAHVVVTFAAYFLFGGWKLFTKKPAPPAMTQSDQAGARAQEDVIECEPFESRHWLTIAVLTFLVVSVIWLRTRTGMSKPSWMTSTRRLLTCICTRTCGCAFMNSGRIGLSSSCAIATGQLTLMMPRGAALTRSTASRAASASASIVCAWR